MGNPCQTKRNFCGVGSANQMAFALKKGVVRLRLLHCLLQALIIHRLAVAVVVAGKESHRDVHAGKRQS